MANRLDRNTMSSVIAVYVHFWQNINSIMTGYDSILTCHNVVKLTEELGL